MKKITKITLISILSVLGACSIDSQEGTGFKVISPAGAPTIAFYDQGDNTNFVTDSTPANVSKELLGVNYDFVVFDSINGLRAIKKNNSDFSLISIITGGNFYLVSYDKDENSIPSKNDTFVSFSENGLPDLVYKKLLESYQGWSNWDMPDANYLTSTGDVSKALISHEYDYYFIAEPSLFAAKAKLGENASKVRIVANLRETWELYSGQPAIPQAGLFVRNSTYNEDELNVLHYVNLLNEKKVNAVDHPEVVKTTIDSWNSDVTTQQSRFGYASSVAFNVQKNGNNGLGVIKDSQIEDIETFVNDFVGFLNNPSYTMFESKYFIK